MTIVGYNCSAATLVIPNTIYNKPVVSIGDNAFKNCTGLTSVTIAATIMTIGNSAFNGCTSLTSAYFEGDAPTIWSHVFDNCASGFVIYYNRGSRGFTNPWHGYPTKVISNCPIVKVLGEDNPKLENLRNFRDSKLAQTAIGRKAINIYYNNAGSINAALDRSPALKALTRRMLEIIAPMVGE